MPNNSSRAPISKVDISTEAFARDAIRRYAEMRREGPIVWQAGTRGFALTGYAETAAALRNKHLLAYDVADGWRALEKRLNRDYGPALQLISFMPFTLDGPRHLLLRRAMAVAVAPFAGGHPAIAAQIDRRLRQATADGGFDLAEDFAQTLLFDILCDFMEIATDERSVLLPIPTLTTVFEGTMAERERQRASKHIGEAIAFLRQHVAKMIVKSNDGFIGGTYNALPADEEDRIDAVATMACVMMVMGNHALGSCITTGVRRLATQGSPAVPQTAWESVSDDAIRYTAPVDFLHRVADRNISLAGCPVSAHERVIISPLAANHDPAEFGGDAGSITARPNGSVGLSFGGGAHVCIGNRLSRTIIRQAFGALATLPELRLSGDPVYGPGKVIRTFSSMPVQLQ